MSEEADKLEAEFSSKAEEVSELKAILDSPAWERLNKIYEGQIQERTGKVVLQPLASADAVYEQEFMKGEISGLHLALALPRTLLESARIDLDRLKEQIKENANVEAERVADGRSGVDGDNFGGSSKHSE